MRHAIWGTCAHSGRCLVATQKPHRHSGTPRASPLRLTLRAGFDFPVVCQQALACLCHTLRIRGTRRPDGRIGAGACAHGSRNEYTGKGIASSGRSPSARRTCSSDQRRYGVNTQSSDTSGNLAATALSAAHGGGAVGLSGGPRPLFPTDMLPRGFILRLTVFLAVLTAIRLAGVYFSNTELFYDEAQYWLWSRELAWGYFSKPPLIGWLIRVGTEICGDGAACIRSISPIVHTMTSVMVFLLGRKLFDERFGFWSAVVFATLPGVSLSSTLITTDVPLLFFWTCALLCLVKLLETRAWTWSVLLGVALGFGMLAKYAMVYFLLGLAIYMAISPRARWLLASLRGWLPLLITLVMLAPNFAWNVGNQFITFAHTADNANWQGSLFHPLQALEFFGAQFGVFGPILFAILIWATWQAIRDGWGDPYKFLLCFSVPIVLLMTMQGLLSRAHANWAAVAYISASVLVAALMVEQRARALYAASFLIHLFALLTIGFGGALAGKIALPGDVDPYARVLGWRGIAEATREQVESGEFPAVMADRRSISAELHYYLRDMDMRIVSWDRGGLPQDHYELTRPITTATPEPILLVTLSPNIDRIASRFESAEKLGAREIPAGPTRSRTVRFFRLEGFRPDG